MGKDRSGGRGDPRADVKCAAEGKRAGTNEADKRDAGTAEVHGADMGKCLTGASIAGACGAGGGDRAAETGRGSLKAIIG